MTDPLAPPATPPLEPVTAPALDRPGLAHGFFTRQGGVSTGLYAGLNCGPGSADKPLAVAENRRRAAAALGLDTAATLYQVHGADVFVLDRPDQAQARPKADAIVTRLKRVAIGVLTADCAPVLLADPDAGVIGAAHAGWRGAVADVTGAALAAMTGLGADRARVVAAIGPCIAQAAYEVGNEVRDAVVAAGGAADLFAPGAQAGKWQFDLAGLVAARLKAAGVGQVARLDLDTYGAPDRFFSYRRATHRGETDYGRQISLIARAH
ncbi:polyphenol oxidase [Rhodothalassium salexigens]|uniref:peptidoglycan editing factor PgeF n=1 Tax=Rhodothalassium salexigens TaxID=1086 RepID=UPI0019124212|nr:peptidoglycan editing factor PgeF [Rhodothalassium salexigens]MBK5921628.1 polyphenol oxidase [Rhodothalassium salexigens]